MEEASEERLKTIPAQVVARPSGRLQKIRKLLPPDMNMSRKELRKELRKVKKERRHAFYTKQPVSMYTFMKAPFCQATCMSSSLISWCIQYELGLLFYYCTT